MADEVRKNTKLCTANEGDDNDVIGFIMTVLGAAFRTKDETTCAFIWHYCFVQKRAGTGIQTQRSLCLRTRVVPNRRLSGAPQMNEERRVND